MRASFRPTPPGCRSRDGEFDIAYSNSVVEHLPPADRAAYAAELRRVGKRWLVQTPNRLFPIEPHALLPFVHWLPRPLGRALWRLGVSGDPYDDVRLLGMGELQRLFPDAVIVRERVGPLTKSFVAVGPQRPGQLRPSAGMTRSATTACTAAGRYGSSSRSAASR